MRDHVARSVDLDRKVRQQRHGEIRELLPGAADPAHQVVGKLPADEHVVGDVEIPRTGPVAHDADAHVLEARALHRQPFRAHDALAAGEYRDLAAAEGQALEIRVIAGRHVEQHAIAVAIEDHRAVARRADHDGTLRGAAGGQVVGAVKHRPHAGAVAPPVVLVEPGVHHDHIAGLHAWRGGVRPVRVRGTGVVGGEQTIEGRLLTLALIARRVHVIRVAIAGRLRFGARARLDPPLGAAGHSVRVGDAQRDLVGSIRLQIEQAAGEHLWRGEIHGEVPGLLAADPEQWQPVTPRVASLAPITEAHRRVAIRIAGQRPLEAQRLQCGRLDDDFTGCHGISGCWCRCQCRHCARAKRQRTHCLEALHDHACSRKPV